MRIGILGAGHIAHSMARTVAEMENAEIFAVGSRSLDKAKVFADEFGIPNHYGSYEELAADDRIDLIYIATPHSRHYEDCLLCLNSGRNILCEKPFTANKKQAEEIFSLAREKQLFACEAIWTRFMPMRKKLDELLNDNFIGRISSLTANLGYQLSHIERLQKPELAGGALLDLGIYPLNFAFMCFGNDIAELHSVCTKNQYGVDADNSMILKFRDGKTALLHSNSDSQTDRMGIIYGSEGRIEVRNINNCEGIDVILNNGQRLKYDRPKQITGYEYEVEAAMRAIDAGESECPEMPHEETLFVLEIMDSFRNEWGIVYPFE